jgi:hypothetical protein
MRIWEPWFVESLATATSFVRRTPNVHANQPGWLKDGNGLVSRRKLLEKLAQGHVKNVSFRDFVTLVEGFGFREVRQQGSHHVFARAQVSELLNLQEVRGEAKPYQIRQFLRLVERYNLRLEDES